MSKRGENIYKRKDGRWEGRYIKFYDPNGRAKYGYIYARTYTEAKQLLLVAQNTFLSMTSALQKNDISYEELLHLWLKSVQLKVKDSTYSRYFHLTTCYLNPTLGHHLLSQINTPFVEQFVQHLLTNGRKDGRGGLSPKTVSDIISILKGTISYAESLHYNINCNLSKLTVRKDTSSTEVLNPIEQSLLTKYLLFTTDLHKLGVLLCLYTGIRIGELCALQWKDISLNKGFVHIGHTLQRIQNTSVSSGSHTKIIITSPKSRSSVRDIPIPAFLLSILAQHQNTPDTYFLTGSPFNYTEPRTMQNHFKKYLTACNIPNTNFHTLRHTFATRCVENGFELKSLSEILGHSSVNITMNKYVHSSFDLKKVNMDKVFGTPS